MTEESWGVLRPLQIKLGVRRQGLFCLCAKLHMQIPAASLFTPRWGGCGGMLSLSLTLETPSPRDKSPSLSEELPGACKATPPRPTPEASVNLPDNGLA